MKASEQPEDTGPGQARPGPRGGSPSLQHLEAVPVGPAQDDEGTSERSARCSPDPQGQMSLLALILHPQAPTPVAAWEQPSPPLLHPHCSLRPHHRHLESWPRPCTCFSHPPSKATKPFGSSACLRPAHPATSLGKTPTPRPQAHSRGGSCCGCRGRPAGTGSCSAAGSG